MKRVAWLTDLHFNFLAQEAIDAFLAQVAADRPDALLVSGDIGEAGSVVGFLRQIAARVDVPVYFVLGNHDFYGGSIREVRAAVAAACRSDRRLAWLNEAGVVELAPQTGLVGHDGWADARLGDYERSLVMMNDYRLIRELAGVGKRERLPLLHTLADEAAATIRRTLAEAAARFPRVVLVTHVPPFREACWHQGRISDDEWLPHFTSHAMGQAILDVMRDAPHTQLTVLCGHTHGRGTARPAANVEVLTGGAEYGTPEVQRVFDFN